MRRQEESEDGEVEAVAEDIGVAEESEEVEMAEDIEEVEWEDREVGVVTEVLL